MFNNPDGSRINIVVPIDIKIKDLFLVYAKKMGVNQNLLGKKYFFCYNGRIVGINEEKDLISFGLVGQERIIVLFTGNFKNDNI